MSFVSTQPDVVAAAATDLASIRSNIIAATTAAAAGSTEVLAPAADEVSTAITALFNAHGLSYQALSAQAADFHAQFVQNLVAGAASYANTEAANVLQHLPNLGIGNIGNGNVGGGNIGSFNFGGGNSGGNLNVGFGNWGSYNFGAGNGNAYAGSAGLSSFNVGNGNIGMFNLGFGNVGGGNIGFGNEKRSQLPAATCPS
ncbi:PE domain-containing protein [Mycobacterium interjectum]|uniref:PE domain-containing protein n=1 Tax=Mycobacterium interjectum TaxID=33895 RepID=UPI0023DFC302|nr:PE domain-containing protein [Mycobacterium interjectum]MCV7090811.1 PE domain-containing protein [Mycobacterium interjectum]